MKYRVHCWKYSGSVATQIKGEESDISILHKDAFFDRSPKNVIQRCTMVIKSTICICSGIEDAFFELQYDSFHNH